MEYVQAAASSGYPPAYLRLAELLIGARIALALRVVAKRGFADILGDDAMSPDELSKRTGLPARSIRRLLRALSSIGVFQEDSDGRFHNSEVSAYMRSGTQPSLCDMAIILNDEALLRGWQQIDEALKTGKPSFPIANGQTAFEYYASTPELSARMAGYMQGLYGEEGARIAVGFPFGRFRNLIDVGGAAGHVLVHIMRTHRGLQAALFELPSTARIAEQHLREQGLADRCRVFAGDFLHTVPPGYDACLLKSVLHDWDDGNAVKILRNCRNSIGRDGRILVAEAVLEPGQPIGNPHRLIDLEMMISLGGNERTADEFDKLFCQAGLRLERVHKIAGSFFSIVEGSTAA